MAMPPFADPTNLEIAEREEGPEGETSLQLMQNVYRDRKLPLSVRVRCAVEALPYENPKLSATAITSMDGKSFADALERAIARSQSPALLNGPVVHLAQGTFIAREQRLAFLRCDGTL